MSDRYSNYINSKEWEARKEHIFEVRGRKCQAEGCTKVVDLQVHHLSYENLGAEPDEDLLVLCSGCHWFVTCYHKGLEAHGAKPSWRQSTVLALDLMQRYAKRSVYVRTDGLQSTRENIRHYVSCPNCGAKEDEPCRDKGSIRRNVGSGGGRKVANHIERSTAFRQWRFEKGLSTTQAVYGDELK